jgi:Na+/serine symporter
MLAEPGFWRIRTNSPTPALLILAESAYPGWQVTVDGQEAEALTAYTTIKAVCVPAGEHIVEWEFGSTVFMAGGAITLGVLALVAVAGVLAFFKRTK